MMKKQDKNFKGKTHTKNLKLKEFEIERPKQKHESKVMFGISYYYYYFLKYMACKAFKCIFYF